jgi:hypothetical protein
LVEDPAGDLVRISDFVSRTTSEPPLNGGGFARYNNVLRRWLPSGSISPDGSAYAYGDDQLQIHIVNIATGQDKVIPLQGAWGPRGWLASGLYVAHVDKTQSVFGGTGYTSFGLWVVDPTTGASRQLSAEAKNWVVDAGAAWGLDRPAGDPRGQGPNRLLRLNLDSRSVDEWYHWPQLNSVQIVGFDSAGAPIVESESDMVTMWLVRARATVETIYEGTRMARPKPPTAVDSHGVWFSGFGSEPSYAAPIWLYSEGAGTRVVASKPPHALSVAGPCA